MCLQGEWKTERILRSQLISIYNQGFFQQFWEKAPGQNWEKMIDLASKLGEINERTSQG